MINAESLFKTITNTRRIRNRLISRLARADMSNQRVHVLCTGGTIQNPPDVEGYLSAAEFVENIPEIHDVADIVPEDISSIASQSMTIGIWKKLAERIESIADVADGIVVTSGSNSVEETAFMLSQVLSTETPVALTAAQRNHTIVGNDGDKNMLDAVRVAVDPRSTGRGPVVVANEEIHAAREVTKVTNSRPNGWTSGDAGVLGLLDKYGVRQYYRTSERAHTADTPFTPSLLDTDTFPTIDIITAAAGADGGLVDAALDRGTDGIVLAGFMSGHSADLGGTGGQAEALHGAAADGLPVVIAHRGLRGWTYFYPDSFATPITAAEEHRDDWNYMLSEDEPYIWGDNLSPQKARILLGLGIANGDDRATIQEYFTRF